MEAGILPDEKDSGKVQFQQELGRWFESRGVITDLRSHLRHLMVTALQSTQMGAKTADRSSPKAQALNLLVAEYLFRRRCHYTLSVFTSEVPTLANFNLGSGLKGDRKRSPKNSFQEEEVEEIFDALGMASPAEELTLLKRKYLERDNEASLVELFLQATLKLATKLHIQQNLESHAAHGERILSKEWSSKVVDVLLSEKISPAQISAVEETILRITESELRRIAEEQWRSQLKVLSVREKRIQQYLRKHEEEMLFRLMEAEKELATRKDLIEEELTEREKLLTKMAMEWNNTHEEILKLSKKFHNIENENRSYKKRLEEVQKENEDLKTQGESQMETLRGLRKELGSAKSKLKEVTDSNAILRERLQAAMDRETKEAFLRQDSSDRPAAGGSLEIPLLWPANGILDACKKQESAREINLGELPLKRQSMPPRPNVWDLAQAQATPEERNCDSSENEEDVSLSSSFADIIHGVQEKLQLLEEESNRLNQNYLEYKLKCISADSDSGSSNSNASTLQSPVQDEMRTTETKFCQTYVEDTFVKIQKLKGTTEEKYEFEGPAGPSKKGQTSPRKPTPLTPTKRQLQNREFFLRNRSLVQQLEMQYAEELHRSLSTVDSATPCSSEELTASPPDTNRKSPAKPVASAPIRVLPIHCEDLIKSSAEGRKMLAENSNQLLKSDADCLALLEETRIKSPQVSARRPLRQQMLLSESDKEEAEVEESKVAEEKVDNSNESKTASPGSIFFQMEKCGLIRTEKATDFGDVVQCPCSGQPELNYSKVSVEGTFNSTPSVNEK